MINQVSKKNAVAVSYEFVSEEGKVTKKTQSFDFMSFEATNEDFYAIGSAIGNMLEYSLKEILKNNVVLLVEE